VFSGPDSSLNTLLCANKVEDMSQIQFLNIDLDIESSVDISPLITEWGSRVSVHRNEEVNGIYYGSFETCCSGTEEILNEYVSLINGLSSSARLIWDNASKRDFDFGFESGISPNNFHSRIESDHINKLARVGGSVVITIYPMQST